jgi:hypothetical protein
MRIKKNSKNHVFLNQNGEHMAIWSIWIKIKPNEKAKQHKIGANWMEFQQSMFYNL